MVFINGKQYKLYRGMGSLGAMRNRGARPVLLQGPLLPGRRACARTSWCPEGIEGQVPYRGPLAAVADQLVGGLRAAMGYCGARTIAELQDARFVQITAAGLTREPPARRHR